MMKEAIIWQKQKHQKGAQLYGSCIQTCSVHVHFIVVVVVVFFVDCITIILYLLLLISIILICLSDGQMKD